MRKLTYHNVCTRDCPASCRLLTEVQGGRVVDVKGDPQDTFTRGYICAKGYSYPERIYSPDRVLYPLKQRKKGSGNWERISWEQALDEIAKKFISISEGYSNLLPVCLDRYLGNLGILNLNVAAFFLSMAPITLMVGSPCVSAGTDGMTLNYGFCRKPVPEDMLNSKLIIIWGGNPAWTLPQQMHYIYEAQKNGAKIVVIDPILTATAARSDTYVNIRPGTDGLLALGMAKILMEENFLDHEFMSGYTHGWDKYKDYLTTIDLEQISTQTNVPSAEIHKLACLYGNTKPATIWIGLGLQRSPSGGQNVRAIDSLAALTGNIGKQGGNVHHISYEVFMNAGELARLQLPWGLASMPEDLKNSFRTIATGRFAELNNLTPPIELLWIAGRNPVAQDQDSDTVKNTLKNIPMVVVADQFLTSSAQYADYFLPVSSSFEHEDAVISYWHYGVGLNEKAIEPLGESKSDFEIMKGLAKAIEKIQPGFTDFPTESDPRQCLHQELEPILKQQEISSIDKLRRQGARIQLSAVPWQDYSFPTPSGKYEFYSLKAMEHGLEPLPIPAQVTAKPASYPFRLMVVRNYATLNSQFYNLPNIRGLESNSTLIIHPETAVQKSLEHGDKVKVYNQLGEIEMHISVSLCLPHNIVVAYMGIPDNHGEVINTLFGLSETDLGEVVSGCKGLTFNDCFVNLVRME